MPHLFENAFTHAAIGMALVGLEGGWLRADRALCQFVGVSEAALAPAELPAAGSPIP